jgi:predicted GH43/DUF377 family glycosyl hydrolase
MTPPLRYIDRSPVLIRPDPTRTVIRPFAPGDPAPFATYDRPRALRIAERILSLSERAAQKQLDLLMRSLAGRHRDIPGILNRRYSEVRDLFEGRQISELQANLIAAYLLEEYSFEAAALFNPSMVRHWDQTGLRSGVTRFVMSMRGIGEGHMSSVTFRTGTWSASGGFTIDPLSAVSVAPAIEMKDEDDVDGVLAVLDCGGSHQLSETVLFPILPSQAKGIEDMRLVQFTDSDDSVRYLGTYSAFDGASVRQELLETEDFFTFTMRRVGGAVANAKGLAIFPRPIDGRYFALARHDNENIWLMSSNTPYAWWQGERLMMPENEWDFVQLGNCGSPLEIEEGWLVLIHGVGMMRNYSIGACLLAKDDPSRVLRRTKLPFLEPGPEDRGGYVPNVIYSCGGMVCGRTLVLPYGVADHFARFATVDIDVLLESMAPI